MLTPFTDDELKIVFAEKNREGKRFRNPYPWWLPILGIYTGARLGELTRLKINQIYQSEEEESRGLWVISIDVSKTENGVRIIPVHPHLIDIGLLDYIEDLKAHGSEYLFPDLNHKMGFNAIRDRASRNFADTLTLLGLKDKALVYHSFRHLVANRLKQEGVDLHMVVALIGHDDEIDDFKILNKHYTKSYNPQILLDKALIHLPIPPEISQIRYRRGMFKKAIVDRMREYAAGRKSAAVQKIWDEKA